ncbi:MAG TPA: sugar ABC transporter permease [Bacillota bacterium]
MGKDAKANFSKQIFYKLRHKESLKFYLFASPWLIGVLVFFIGPALISLYLSLTKYDIISSPEFIGLKNYRFLFTMDDLFYKSLANTLYMVFIALPIGIIAQISLSLFMNLRLKGIAFFRTIYYLPVLVPAVSSAILWRIMLDDRFGLINVFLRFCHIPPQEWLNNPVLSKPSLILMGLWTIGDGMLIYLANLKDIPGSLYESAAIDGANAWHKFWAITLPMITPTIFFNLIMGVINTFQTFTSAYVMTAGGPEYSTYFYMYYLYQTAFKFGRMGMASAMAWILFLVILVLTVIILRSSKHWVFYEGERK